VAELGRSAKVMKPVTHQFDDEEISISLTSEEFDQRICELLPPDEATKISPICTRVIYWRGEVPKPYSPRIAILCWLASIILVVVLFYGAYSLIRDFLLI
jgi:hypothetical protein